MESLIIVQYVELITFQCEEFARPVMLPTTVSKGTQSVQSVGMVVIIAIKPTANLAQLDTYMLQDSLLECATQIPMQSLTAQFQTL